MSSPTIEDGNFKVSVSELLRLLSGDAKRDLIAYLACDEEVLCRVTDQIIDRMTEDGWCGGTSLEAVPFTAIDRARRKIAEAKDKIAADEIAKLMRCVEREKESAQKAWDQYHALRRRHES